MFKGVYFFRWQENGKISTKGHHNFFTCVDFWNRTMELSVWRWAERGTV